MFDDAQRKEVLALPLHAARARKDAVDGRVPAHVLGACSQEDEGDRLPRAPLDPIDGRVYRLDDGARPTARGPPSSYADFLMASSAAHSVKY